MSAQPLGTVRRGGRSARTRDAVLAAALEELKLYGYAGFSTLRVAERAGVHRTTVHRRWPDHADLITDALLAQATTAIPIPDTGDIRSDLEQLLTSIVALIDTDSARSQIRALVADSVRSEAIGAVVGRVWRERFALGEAIIARGQTRGEIRTDIDAATLLSVFTGPLYLRLLITGERLDASFLSDVISTGLDGAAPRGTPASST